MTYSLLDLNAKDFLHQRNGIVEVYRTAFSQPPYYRTELDAAGFSERLDRHVSRPEFRSVIAREDSSGAVVGFAYGYVSLPGQWWFDVVTDSMSQEMIHEWIYGSFELVELAVRPEHQGCRLGSGLHDRLFTSVPQPKAVLSTMRADTTALKLYRRRGWVVLVDDFQFPGVSRPYQIMGWDRRKLPLIQ